MMMMKKMFMKVAIFHVDSEEKSALTNILFTSSYNSHGVYCEHNYHQYNKTSLVMRRNPTTFDL